jgi:DNA-binding YbaB/EbfC family protein
MFPGMDPGRLQKTAQQMQRQLEKLDQDLKERIVDATAGGGMVCAKASGVPEIVDIKIDPEVIKPEDKGMLEDLLIAAVNEALHKARAMRQAEQQKVLGPLPGLGGLL